MHPVTAHDFLNCPGRMAARHGSVEVIIRNNRNLLGYAANLFDRRAAKDSGTHGDETAGGKQLRENVAFGQRRKLVRLVVVTLHAAGIEPDGTPVDDSRTLRCPIQASFAWVEI